MNEAPSPEARGAKGAATGEPGEPSDVPDDVVGRLATALRGRVETARQSEARLAAFAFTERPAVHSARSPTEPQETSADWEYFVASAFRAAGDPTTLRTLQVLRGGPGRLDDLAGFVGSETLGRLAISDWVGGLASAGLVSRELESNRVSLTPLGASLVDLVAETGRRARAGA